MNIQNQLLLLGFYAGMASPVCAQLPYSSLQVPPQIQYQGRVSTAAGEGWTGETGYFAFALFEGGTILWNNWQGQAAGVDDPGQVPSLGVNEVLTLPVTKGLFSLRLGEDSGKNKPIPATVFFNAGTNSVRFGVKLAVWFSPSGSPPFTRLSPDVEFTSVPYAMVSGIAESVKERAVTSAMLEDGAIGSSKMANSAVSSAKLEDGAIGTVKLANAAVTTAKIADGTLEAADMSPSLQLASLIPVGSVFPYAGSQTPAGWESCYGQSVAKDDPKYAALFAVIGTAHGSTGNNFNLPDYRGRFLRGVSFETSKDPDRTARTAMNPGGLTGNNIGSVQDDMFRSHNHPIASQDGATTFLARPGSGAFSTSGGGAYSVSTTGTIGNAGGSETRPTNAYVNYIIKL